MQLGSGRIMWVGCVLEVPAYCRKAVLVVHLECLYLPAVRIRGRIPSWVLLVFFLLFFFLHFIYMSNYVKLFIILCIWERQQKRVSECVRSLGRRQTCRCLHMLPQCGGFNSVSLSSCCGKLLGLFIDGCSMHGSSVSLANTQVGVRLQRGAKRYSGNTLSWFWPFQAVKRVVVVFLPCSDHETPIKRCALPEMCIEIQCMFNSTLHKVL